MARPLRDALVADQEVEIVPERLGEFGLAVEQVHNAQVGRQPCDIGVEHRAADPAALGLRPEPLEAAAEISRSRADRLRRHQRMIGRAGLAAPFRRRRRSRGSRGRGGRSGAGGGARRTGRRADVQALAEYRRRQDGRGQNCAGQTHQSGKCRHDVFISDRLWLGPTMGNPNVAGPLNAGALAARGSNWQAGCSERRGWREPALLIASYHQPTLARSWSGSKRSGTDLATTRIMTHPDFGNTETGLGAIRVPKSAFP